MRVLRTALTGATAAAGAVVLAAVPAAAGFNPDLGVAVTDSPDPVAPGAPLTYSIAVDNPHDGSSFDPQLQIPIPAGTTFQSFTAPPGWTANTPAVGGTGVVTSTIAVTGPGEDMTFTLVVVVDPAATPGQVLAATASITAPGEDPAELGDNTDTESTTVAAAGVTTTTTTPTPITPVDLVPLPTTTSTILARTGGGGGRTAITGAALVLAGAGAVAVAGAQRRRLRPRRLP